ncbi:MAG: 4Fe-4S dicluster domain-containing protein [Deltaproteobacteria bacterium]|nr:4Fe-4S dicluster domain-containing protein [Deltaproteobacteria bacterium]
MKSIEESLRQEAKRLLSEKRVDVVVGYEAGPLPATTAPAFVTDPEGADRLVWNPFCSLNLAKYVHDLLFEHRQAQKRVKPEERRRKVVAVVARGCTSRSVVLHLQERQYEREDVVLLGVPCAGFVDRRKAAKALQGEELLGAGEDGDRLTLRSRMEEKSVPLAELLAESCAVCRTNQPVLADVFLGDPAPAMDCAREYASVEEHEKLELEERWAAFARETAKCIRCFACRNACPGCYCKSCAIEQTQPEWMGITVDPSDTQVFQLMRIYHQAGRCVDCGACAAACPMGVDLRKYLKKLDKDAFELFGRRAGESLDGVPVLAEASEKDEQSFIFEPK